MLISNRLQEPAGVVSYNQTRNQTAQAWLLGVHPTQSLIRAGLSAASLFNVWRNINVRCSSGNVNTWLRTLSMALYLCACLIPKLLKPQKTLTAMYPKVTAIASLAGTRVIRRRISAAPLCFREYPSWWLITRLQRSPSHISQVVRLLLLSNTYRDHVTLGSLDRGAFIRCDGSGGHTVPCWLQGHICTYCLGVYVPFFCSWFYMLQTMGWTL